MTGVVVGGRPGKVPDDAFWSGGGRSQSSLAERRRNWQPGGGSGEAWKVRSLAEGESSGLGGGLGALLKCCWGRDRSGTEQDLARPSLEAFPSLGLISNGRIGRTRGFFLRATPVSCPDFWPGDGLPEPPAGAKGKSPLWVSPLAIT